LSMEYASIAHRKYHKTSLVSPRPEPRANERSSTMHNDLLELDMQERSTIPLADQATPADLKETPRPVERYSRAGPSPDLSQTSHFLQERGGRTRVRTSHRRATACNSEQLRLSLNTQS